MLPANLLALPKKSVKSYAGSGAEAIPQGRRCLQEGFDIPSGSSQRGRNWTSERLIAFRVILNLSLCPLGHHDCSENCGGDGNTRPLLTYTELN